jgi:hypothetical protein
MPELVVGRQRSGADAHSDDSRRTLEDPPAVRRCFRTRVLDARSSLAAGERPAVVETMQPPIETAVDSATGSNPATRSTTAERWSNYRRRRPVERWPAWAAGQADSPAASWPTAPRLNAPSPWPSGWAASTPLAAQLGTTWPSLRKPPSPRAWRIGPQPDAIRQRASTPPTSASHSYPWQPSTPLDGQRARRADRRRTEQKHRRDRTRRARQPEQAGW